MAESRVWVAPLGTPLDGPGWTDIGTLAHDGLLILDDPVRDEPPVTSLLGTNGPAITITLTCARSPFGWWRLYRDLFRETHPSASRVKRAYHRRRR